MKRTAVAVLLLFLSLTSSRGQSIAWNNPMSQLLTGTLSFSQSPPHKKMCGAAKVGLITVGSGIVIGCTGVAFMFGNMSGKSKGHGNTNGDNAHMGALMFAAGGLLEVIGGALVLGGSIHDHLQKRRISFVYLERDQLGIAYNF